jgi:16S rRNA (cytosine1402-N4)-methyltransferase
VGAGGHAAGILEASGPDGELLGLDRDPAALTRARARLARFSERAHLVHRSFAEMHLAAAALHWTTVSGVLLDLGLSSLQVDDPARGFAFRFEGPLDMRFDPTQPTTASDLVNGLSETDLADLLWRFGEEPRARQVARRIVTARPLATTTELAQTVGSVTQRGRSRIHPATRVFQALRIAVNGELDALQEGLRQALGLLAPGGRIVVIAFHSLEDRIVKEYFRRESRDCLCPPGQPVCTCGHRAALRILTRKPVRPEEGEVQANPRARSARLRVAERLAAA